MVSKANARMETCMKAVEKAIEENHRARELGLTSIKLVSMKMVKGTMLEVDQGFNVEVKRVEEEKTREAVYGLVAQVLTQFEQVFQEPQGLPPHRERERSWYYYPGGHKDTQFKALQIPQSPEG